jgi:CBS domain containing-hemolysin-like protein
MTAASYFWLSMGGLFLMTLAATGVKVLYEIAWHELKEYCKRKHVRPLFDQIHDEHDAVTLGLETLRAIGVLTALIGGAGWYIQRSAESAFDTSETMTAIAGWAAAVIAGSVWIPGGLAHEWGPSILYRFWRVFRWTSYLMYPISVGATLLDTAMRRMFAKEDEPSEEEAFEDEVLAIVTEGMHDGHLEADAREMIEGVIELGDGDVADIMTPRSKMDATSIDDSWENVLKFVSTCGRTRIPVYEGNIDHIVGVLYVKDLLAELSQHQGCPEKSLRELLRAPWYVPPSQKLDDLLNDFRQTRNHLAIVRDEFSRVAGLVTIEDVLEEIVGEIVDESDKEDVEEIHRVDDRTAVIQGRAHLAEVNEALGLSLPEPDDFDTIAGYVINHLGHIPMVGEKLSRDSVLITVLQATKRKVERVKLEMAVQFDSES